ncbi:MAG: ATP-dependent RecD-like DNA helicase [Acidobacteriota bacterium]
MERVVYEQEGGSWAVVRLRLDDGASATAVGNLAPVFEGERLEIDGGWVEDARFGRQFRADRATTVRPADAAAIERYLASGVVPGIGAELAARIVERFGEQTLEVFDNTPDKLLSVRGIGSVRLERIKETWQQQAAERDTRIFLQGLGLGPFLTDKILRAWGEEAERRVRDNPYTLASSGEVSGIGFRRADQIARNLPGWAPEASGRARAGIEHVLQEQANQGHCFVPYARLVRLATELLVLDDAEVVRKVLDGLLAEGALAVEPLDDAEVAALSPTGSAEVETDPCADDGHRAVWDPAFLDAERRVARRLLRVLAAPAADGKPGSFDEERAAKAARWVEDQLGVQLGTDQRYALQLALSNKVLLVTGGPGTGKTTLIDAIVRCGLAVGARLALAAPTGRAAKRLSEATGHVALTLHRLLEFRPQDGGFTRNGSNPLDTDVIVVDEASMIDLFLMDALVAAVPPTAVLVLVGDADQLPPVGPGAVLRDLLASEVLPTVRLTEIYRQAQRSLIVRNAHRVNRGELPEGLDGAAAWEDGALLDFYFINENDADRARNIALTLAADRIPTRFGLDPLRDVQVVAPMHRGKAGVSRLNLTLQERLNAGAGGRRVGDYLLRAGDRVIQQRNDYDREVFNGDVGRVISADPEGDIVVEFDGRPVSYDPEAARHLSLAYAISVHKSQGSEYPAVVVLLLPEHYPMLQRNLLYTALTRAKKLAVLVGSRRAVARAVANAAPQLRCTRLAHRLAHRPTLTTGA